MSVIICFVIAFSVALLCLLFLLGGLSGISVFPKSRKEGEEEDTMLKERGMIPCCMLLVLSTLVVMICPGNLALWHRIWAMYDVRFEMFGV